MYPLDLISLPGTFLRRTRLWYARGRTWRDNPSRTTAPQPAHREERTTTDRTPAARAG
jgi:hypothetical protein